jgi:hypothetical protein
MWGREKQAIPASLYCIPLITKEFYERAIIDCQQSVEAVERSRLEYRGSLLWMKDCSETLDPERKNSNNLEVAKARGGGSGS